MKVTIPVTFSVRAVCAEDEDELTEEQAKDAATLAAYDYLSFCEVSGYSTDTESVEVHVDGFGRCEVLLEKE